MEFSKDQETVTMSWEEFCKKIEDAYNEGYLDCAFSYDNYPTAAEVDEQYKASLTHNQTLLREKDVKKDNGKIF